MHIPDGECCPICQLDSTPERREGSYGKRLYNKQEPTMESWKYILVFPHEEWLISFLYCAMQFDNPQTLSSIIVGGGGGGSVVYRVNHILFFVMTFYFMAKRIVVNPYLLFSVQGQKGEPGDVPYVCYSTLVLLILLKINCCTIKQDVTCLSDPCRWRASEVALDQWWVSCC